MKRFARNAPVRRGRLAGYAGCGPGCSCGPACPCKVKAGGLGGFNPADFGQKLAAYETWAHLADPDYGRAVSQIVDTYWRGVPRQLAARRRGLGDGTTDTSSAIYQDYNGTDTSYLDITPVSGPDLSTFIPADSSNPDSTAFTPDTITITAASGGGPAPIDITPWLDGTAIAPVTITPPDFTSIAQNFSNLVPATSSSLADAARKVAAGISALAARAASALKGGQAGQAAAGAAQLKQAAASTPAKKPGQISQAGGVWIILAALGIWAAFSMAEN